MVVQRALLFAVVGAMCLMAFSRPLQPKAVFDIVGIPDSGGHSGRHLDYYPGRDGPGLNSGHSYSSGGLSEGEVEADAPGESVAGFGEVAGAFYFFGPGRATTVSVTKSTTEKQTHSSEKTSTFSSSRTVVDTRNSKNSKKSKKSL